MKFRKLQGVAIIIFAALLFASCQKETTSNSSDLLNSDIAQKANKISGAGMSTVKVFATGFNNPRGLKFGPDGNLYVAEGGTGGVNSGTGDCDPVISPVGPYTGDYTARISKVTPNGERTTVVDYLPSSQTSPALGSLVSGVADVAFVGNTLYALIGGGGCSHTFPNDPNGVIKINPDGSWSMVANLSDWSLNNPVAQPEEDDFEPDGTWYSMINVRGDLYAIEPNHGELVKVTTDGIVSRVVDISASQGHIVPTAIAYHGNFFIGNLFTFPIPGDASKIIKVTPDGTIKDWVTGLNTVLGLVIDNQNRMYVLENTAGAPGPTPGLGSIIRIDPNGKKETIVTGLNLPTGMTMGPDGKLYVSNWGFGPPALGGGEILQINVNN